MISAPSLWLLGLLFSHATLAASRQESKDNLLQWFQEKGGKFNPKQEIRDLEKGGKSRSAIFANEPVSEGEVLAYIPWEIVVAPEDYGSPEYAMRGEEDDFDCDAARTWAKAMENPSFTSYLQHLQSHSERFSLPSHYSRKGRKLFFRIMGGQDYSQVFIDNPVTLHEMWAESCGFPLDDDEEEDNQFDDGSCTATMVEAALMVTQFSFDGLMIPLHDLYGHRNGPYHNTKVTVVAGEFVQIEARRDVSAGEQLYSSYDEYDEPESYLKNPAEVLRDHGFVPEYPHNWAIPGEVIRISTDEEEETEGVVHTEAFEFNVTIDQTTGEVELLMEITTQRRDELHGFLHGKVKDLNHLKNIELKSTAEENGLPQAEWDTLTEFLDVYLDALKRGFHQVHEEVMENTDHFSETDVRVREDNSDHHYSLLWGWFDDTPYNDATCPSSEWTEFASYDSFEVEMSNYQEMEWRYREEDDDTCLHLDNMLQICSGYRPHYHEFFVHYSARYVPSVKRVIFLGSGDAMLLHEILKYPELEKVVGLELDQHVTRKSFKHFETQPHYDDPRVEWWYGDATKTLPLLPRDYWGSFDLLLVDLSETVVSLHVTGKHDVLAVISNLLKPEGVMFENELYLHQMSSHFDHTVQLFYGSPKVCTQVQTVSSNKVDFLTSPIYDHGVHTFLIDDVKDPWDRFRYIHDYADTDARDFNQCDDGGDEDSTEHGRKAGILMVLEAENVSTTLDDTLEGVVYGVVQAAGLTPLTGQTRTSNGTIQAVMKEGYVVARPWPDLKYVAFDIALWGAFNKMEVLRTALSESVGSNTTSSFRVVVGGMHGSNTWEQDQTEVGVRFSQSRDCSATDLSGMEVDEESVTNAALKESFELLPDSDDLNVLVLCGPENEPADCISVETMRSHEAVKTVIPIWSCDGIPEFNDGSKPFVSMIACEEKVIADLESHQEQVGKFDMLVADISTPSSMLQVFESILGYNRLRRKLMEPESVILTPYEESDVHRFRFMHEVKSAIRDGFVSLGEFHFRGMDDEFLGVSVLVHGNEYAIYSLATMEIALDERLPTTDVEIHAIISGSGHAEIDKKLEERVFRPEDYDAEPSKKQFQEQRPLGRQTIIQLELSSESATMPSLEELAAAVEVSLQSINVREVEDMRIIRDVGDGGVALSRFESGNVVLTWDGEDHVDINLFIVDQDKTIVDSFLAKFLEQTHGQLSRTLRDDQPRGIGRVVNFQSDIGEEPSR